MSDIVVHAEGLSKSYRITHRPTGYRTLQEDVVAFFRGGRGDDPRVETFWALRDINFTIRQGEVVGIIGRNGAGKSTLLKVLSRITRPTTGFVDVYGRVGSLLEIGTGFHMELSGRENIFLNGATLGMSRTYIRRQFDAIVAFAEVEQFLDTPVKRYSSGMYMRLAFAVAAHLEPEILIVDEVLAVGDTKFQQKSLGKMDEVAKSGRTVLFVSHNLAAVQALCTRGILLERGRLRTDGTVAQAIGDYLISNNAIAIDLSGRTDRLGSGEVYVHAVQIADDQGRVVDEVASGQDVTIRFLYKKRDPAFFHPGLRFSLWIKTRDDFPIVLHHNRLSRQAFASLPDEGAFVCTIQNLPLAADTYYVTYSLMIADESYVDSVEHAAELTVIAGDFYGSGEIPPHSFGHMLMAAGWHVEPRVGSLKRSNDEAINESLGLGTTREDTPHVDTG